LAAKNGQCYYTTRPVKFQVVWIYNLHLTGLHADPLFFYIMIIFYLQIGRVML